MRADASRALRRQPRRRLACRSSRRGDRGDPARGAARVEPAGASTPRARYEPAVEPRALALGPVQSTLYVTGHRSGRVYALDAATGKVLAQAPVCSEPVGVLVSPLGDTPLRGVLAGRRGRAARRADASRCRARVATRRKPWTLGVEPGPVAHLRDAPARSGVERAPRRLRRSSAWPLADGVVHGATNGTDSDPLQPHGVVRGIYDVLRPPRNERDLGRAHDARHRHAGARCSSSTTPCSRRCRCSTPDGNAARAPHREHRARRRQRVRRRGVGAARDGVLGRRQPGVRRRQRERGRPGRRREAAGRDDARPPPARPPAGGRSWSAATAASTSTSATRRTSPS